MTMSGRRLEGLQVLVTGISEQISRAVVYALVSEGALVTAADCDEGVLGRLLRDLGLYRATADVAEIDLFNASEMRLFAANMQGLGRLPHVIVCCCRDEACPAALAASLLRPSLTLHTFPCAGARLRRVVVGMGIPSLPDLIERNRRRRVLDPGSWPRRVSIGRHVFGLRHGDEPPARTSSGTHHSPPTTRRTLATARWAGGTPAARAQTPDRRRRPRNTRQAS